MTTDNTAHHPHTGAEGESESTEVLLRELRRLGPGDRDEIEARVVRRHMPLARRIAAYFAGRGVPTEDLQQVAYLGLVNSVRRFDPDRGKPFVSFASVTIRGHIRRHFRDCGWVIRPPRTLQELQAKIWVVRDDLTCTLGRPPTLREMATAVGADVKDVDEALGLRECFTVSVLDAPVHDSHSLPLMERIGACEEGFDRIDAILLMRDAVRTLKDRDREVLRLRFFEGLSQREVGEHLGVTQMQVSRLLTRILGELRDAMEAPVAA